MHVLYEEDGSYKAATILADQNTSFMVEAPHGKRSKIKAAHVLLQFKAPAPAELIREAETLAATLDTDFLWQCSTKEEFDFQQLAEEYFGHAPSAVEAVAILLQIQAAPIYFYRKGRGRFKAAPEESLKAALSGLEKKRLQALAIERMADELATGKLPPEFAPMLQDLLYRPDRNRVEVKALELACEKTGMSAPKLLERCGALPSTHDYHLGRFLFEHYPDGTAFPPFDAIVKPTGLERALTPAFSIDDAATTEIDDAFSVARLESGHLLVGIHIAAPGLGFAPGSALDQIARRRLSTAYMPGRKITMLPETAIEEFTLAEGRWCPALSLYMELEPESHTILAEETKIELVSIAANLRHTELDAEFTTENLETGGGNYRYKDELATLWRLALALETSRGKSGGQPDRVDYNFTVIDDHVTISERERGSPLDKVVSELMIHANSVWGGLLAERGYPAIYRAQSNGKVRMTTVAAEHQGLGVAQYAWSSSPLRRYVDLVNQWQLIAAVRGEPAPFARNSEALLSALRDFELTYSAYAGFQEHMERYWCLRWLLQENVKVTPAVVVRDNLVRFAHIPLYVRVASLPELEAGSTVEVEVGDIDLITLSFDCVYKGKSADKDVV
jgi:exoribonuclease II